MSQDGHPLETHTFFTTLKMATANASLGDCFVHWKIADARAVRLRNVWPQRVRWVGSMKNHFKVVAEKNPLQKDHPVSRSVVLTAKAESSLIAFPRAPQWQLHQNEDFFGKEVSLSVARKGWKSAGKGCRCSLPLRRPSCTLGGSSSEVSLQHQVLPHTPYSPDLAPSAFWLS